MYLLLIAVLLIGCTNPALDKAQNTAKQEINSAGKALSLAKKTVPASVVRDFDNSLTKIRTRLKKATKVEALKSITQDAVRLRKSVSQTEARWEKAKSDVESGIAQAEAAIGGAVVGSYLEPAKATFSQARTKLTKAASFEDLKTALDLANQTKDQADKASVAKKAADEEAAAQTNKTNGSVVTNNTAQEQGTDELSSSSLKYAKDLGGTPHKGKTLFFIIGATEQTEAAARKRIENAVPLFGDMQSYFIAEPSSHLTSNKPGYWLVVEAYRDQVHAEDNLDFTKRAFKNPYIKQSKVKCDDPIPVYEERVNL